ncbi:SDR family oxidoreductase [Rhizobium leguminosarum bv. viciae]|nr:SDR family oxidoreductase [Rhizobium leguminosarum bv. viciae]NKM96100.1 SDR family oxidoreductase [Rhizobium leguminosarum bv. viciae]
MLRDQERIRSQGHHSPRSLRHWRVRTETAMSGLNLTMLPEAGSRVVVAGGCGGIGKILVKACVDHRMDVTVLDTPSAIESAEAIEGVSYVAFDGRDPESIVRAVNAVTARHDGLECLFFLSGFPIIPRRPLSEVPIDKWNELMSVNLTSAYLLVNGLSPLLKQGRDPAIVTVASSLAYQVMPGMSAYAASKGGLISLTKAFAAELAPTVRANSVAPGAVDTDFLSGGTGRVEDKGARSWFDDISAKYVASIPLGRVADEQDVVGPMLFLAGQGSRYMTGQVLHLNGGRLTP